MPRSSTAPDSLHSVRSHPIRSNAIRALAAVVAVALATVGLPQSAATAASTPAAPVPSTLAIPMGNPESSTHVEYGAAPGQPISIGSATSVIVIQPELESPGAQVGCFLSHGGTFADKLYSAAEWNSGQVEFAITPTAGDPSDSLSCYSQDFTAFEITWHLTPDSTTSTRIILTEGAEFLTSRNDAQWYRPVDEAGTIGVGDTIRVVGAPGTWPAVGGDPAPEFSAQFFVRDPRGAVQNLTDYRVSADGSVLTIQVPDTLAPRFWGSPVYLGAGATTTLASSPLRTVSTGFESAISVRPDRVSTTRLTLLPPVALSNHTTRAVVRLSSPGLTDVYGRLFIYIDGRESQWLTVEPQDHSRVTFRIPALPKGTHKITIYFEGDPRGVAGSSATANLRVLR